MIFSFLRLCLDERTHWQVPLTAAVVCPGVCSYSSVETCTIVQSEIVGITWSKRTLNV